MKSFTCSPPEKIVFVSMSFIIYQYKTRAFFLRMNVGCSTWMNVIDVTSTGSPAAALSWFAWIFNALIKDYSQRHALLSLSHMQFVKVTIFMVVDWFSQICLRYALHGCEQNVPKSPGHNIEQKVRVSWFFHNAELLSSLLNFIMRVLVRTRSQSRLDSLQCFANGDQSASILAFVSTLRLLVSFSLQVANECLLYICACLDAGSLGFVVSCAEFVKNNREFEMADVVVFGVCGEVGRAVATHLSKVFRVQGVAYDDNDQCKADLMSAGVNVTSFDRKALCDVTRGAKFCFVNTRSSFADASSHAKEVEQGVAIADACKQSDVTHVVYMTQHHVANAIGLSARQADAKVHVVHTCLSYQSFCVSLHDICIFSGRSLRLHASRGPFCHWHRRHVLLRRPPQTATCSRALPRRHIRNRWPRQFFHDIVSNKIWGS